MKSKCYYETYDEVLLEHNNRGGAPIKPGSTRWDGRGSEISEIKEETQKRFHLGYCRCCGERIVIGERRAEEFIRVLTVEQGVRPREIKIPWRIKIAAFILRRDPEHLTLQ